MQACLSSMVPFALMISIPLSFNEPWIIWWKRDCLRFEQSLFRIGTAKGGDPLVVALFLYFHLTN